MGKYKIKASHLEKIKTEQKFIKVTGKQCYICNTVKDKDEFYADKSRVDGFSYYCKPCGRERGREYYKENTEKAISSSIKWLKENPKKRNKYMRTWRRKHRDSYNEYMRGRYKQTTTKER